MYICIIYRYIYRSIDLSVNIYLFIYREDAAGRRWAKEIPPGR